MLRPVTKEETEAFLKAREQVLFDSRQRGNRIGELCEKTLHAVVKLFLEPDSSFHEIKVGRHYADICRDGKITEIQTRSFDRLREKLSELTAMGFTVTVVHPIAKIKTLYWIDSDKSVSDGRKSPKRGTTYTAFNELYRLCPLFKEKGMEGIRICLLYLSVSEYRLKNGWSSDGKRGSWRYEQIPEELFEIQLLEKQEDFYELVPKGLPPQFTATDFARCAKITKTVAYRGLAVLREMKVLEEIGKKGRIKLFSVVEK